MKICNIKKCSAIVVARGWCDKHYRRWKKYGDPNKLTRKVYGLNRKVYTKMYYENNKEIILNQKHNYYKKNQIALRSKKMVYSKKNRKILRQRSRRFYRKNSSRLIKKQTIYRFKQKLIVIKYYSRETYRCKCCGEDNIQLLTIDHINNDGKKFRPFRIAIWLIKNNFPKGFQILCYNCNLGRARNDSFICPHKKQKFDNATIARLKKEID